MAIVKRSESSLLVLICDATCIKIAVLVLQYFLELVLAVVLKILFIESIAICIANGFQKYTVSNPVHVWKNHCPVWRYTFSYMRHRRCWRVSWYDDWPYRGRIMSLVCQPQCRSSIAAGARETVKLLWHGTSVRQSSVKTLKRIVSTWCVVTHRQFRRLGFPYIFLEFPIPKFLPLHFCAAFSYLAFSASLSSTFVSFLLTLLLF